MCHGALCPWSLFSHSFVSHLDKDLKVKFIKSAGNTIGSKVRENLHKLGRDDEST